MFYEVLKVVRFFDTSNPFLATFTFLQQYNIHFLFNILMPGLNACNMPHDYLVL